MRQSKECFAKQLPTVFAAVWDSDGERPDGSSIAPGDPVRIFYE
jgi:hypothetical protein